MRAETGPMQFKRDWPGVFIRGDNASYYAFNLRMLLEDLAAGDGTTARIDAIRARELLYLCELLASCVEPLSDKAKESLAQMKLFEDCVASQQATPSEAGE